MKFSYSLLLAIGASAFMACSDTPIISESSDQGEYSVEAILDPLISDNMGITRVVPNDKGDGHYSFGWQANDKIAIYGQTPNSSGWGFFQLSGDGGDAAGVFSGIFKMTNETTYYSFYPPRDFTSETSPSTITLDYTGQKQIADGDMSHLRNYIYYAAAQADDGRFKFKHVGALLKITLPDEHGDDCTSVTLSAAGDGKFITKGKIDLTTTTTTQPPSVTPVETSSTFSIGYSQGSSKNTGQITVFAMMAPTDLSNIETLTATIVHNNSLYDRSYGFSPQAFLAGKPYDLSPAFEISPVPYVTFSANTQQTMTMTKAVPTLEYSVDGSEWQELGTKTIPFGGLSGNLRLRGKSSFGTSKEIESSWSSIIRFGNSDSKVSCCGDIRTLVDYEHYEDVDTSNARFRSLFSNNTQLISSPDLPATELADHCYECMFLNCHNLIEAPELPAQKLQTGCYNGMFYGCYKINYVKTKAENFHWSYCEEWLDECFNSGIVEKTINWDFEETGYVPLGWTVKYVDNSDNVVNYPDYITFSSLVNQTLQLTDGDNAHDGPLEYSLSNGEWKLLGSNIIEFGGGKGDLRLRKNNNLGTVGTFVFGNEAKVQCTGDIRTLIDYKHFSDDICGSFRSLFKDCSQLVQAPRLPSINLYFEGCYSEMFKGCSSLVQAPALPAERLSRLCYYAMFEDCISLSQPPTLPAMNLADWCYVSMFNGCSSLTQAPILPALKLKDTCYGSIFRGCSNISYIKMLATDISAEACLNDWISGVSLNGTFVKNVNATWNNNGIVPAGWVVETVE